MPLCRVDSLSCATRTAMRQLFDLVYVGDDSFEKDLSEKDWVLLLHDERQRLVGFSSLRRGRHLFRNEPVTVFFSGDTVVHPASRNNFDLPRRWAQAVFSLVEQESNPCYWFLICSGFRTYRFLPIFYRQFYPRFDRPTPPEIAAFMDQLALGSFAELYDPQRGIVRLQTPCREPLPPRKLDPHSRYFLERNPGWSEGHELVCLTELSLENQSPALHRLLRS